LIEEASSKYFREHEISPVLNPKMTACTIVLIVEDEIVGIPEDR